MSPGRGGLLASLPGEALALIDRAVEFGRRYAIDLFLVGGAVRDLYLGEEVRDLDLVWVGSGNPAVVARAFGEFFNAEVLYHPEFLTASLTGKSGLRLDLGRARSESYSAAAALPSVQPADLGQDLIRRDFSVNAMAVPLAQPEAAIDPCDGATDLRRGRLRTLHELSFRDDPTRILRGLELAVRRGFEFDSSTRGQAEEAISEGYLALLSGTRVRHELVRLFASPLRAASAAEGLRALAIDRTLHEEFRIDGRGLERLRRLASWRNPEERSAVLDSTPFWIVALTALLWDLKQSTRRDLAERLSLGRDEKRWLEHGPERVAPLLDPASAVESSIGAMAQLYAHLSRSEARLVELLAAGGQVERVRRARKLSELALGIGGEDLLAAGAPPGPRMGAALEATLAARRAGEIEADEELGFAVEWLAREDPDGDP